MHALGRLMQMAGLVILPLGILLELQSEEVTVKQSLLMCVFGVALFGLGYLIQGFGGRQD